MTLAPPRTDAPTQVTRSRPRVSDRVRRNAALTAVLACLLDGPAPLRRLILRGLTGGAELASLCHRDGDLADYVRGNVFGVWHAGGTCRMGATDDPDAVVDPAGRVIGLEGLTVADASIMPRIVGGNTNAPVIMIAEKAADMVRAEAASAA